MKTYRDRNTMLFFHKIIPHGTAAAGGGGGGGIDRGYTNVA